MEDPLKQPDERRHPERTPEAAGVPAEQHAKPLYPGLPTGTGLGKYRILERLWTAHNAIVYKARDAMLDRLVTIKQMSPVLIDNPIACGHFKREAQFLARVPKDAKHIVNIHELIEDDVGLFIVEEYVIGHWLESMIAKRQTNPYAAVRLLRTAAQGLRTLHSLDLMHRGVHPGNIVVARNHSVKIANLGTASHESDTTPPPTIRPKYCAPELLIGESYDNRIDIYSLGLSIYEFCVGRREMHEHFGQSVESSPAAVDFWTRWHTDMTSSLPDAAELNPQVLPALSSIIRKMTAKRLDERYASIQDVLDDLARHFEASPERAEPRQFMPLGTAAVLPSISGAPRQGYILESRSPGALLPPSTPPAAPATSVRTTLKHTVRQPVRTEAPSPPVEPRTVLPAVPVEFLKIRAPGRHPGLRPRPGPKPPARPMRPEAIPAPVQADEVHRQHPHLVTWLVAASVFFAAVVAGVGTMWYYHASSVMTRESEQLLAAGVTDYQRGSYDSAHQKFLAATEIPITTEVDARVRDRAESWLPMTEARLALARNEFDEALRLARQAEKRGISPAEVTELQQLCWTKKDAYRLEAESSKALEQGRLQEAEFKLGEYKEKAQASGLDSSKLEIRLQQTKADQRYDEAMKRAQQALEQGDFDRAAFAVGDAERVRSSADTRRLRQRISDAKERADWIQRGDNAMEDKDYAEAALAYEKANQKEATAEIEKKTRLAAALLLYNKALDAYAKGDLLTAERHLQSSIWKSPTQQASTRLEKLAPVFEAARTAHKADLEAEKGNYAEAERLYSEAIPALPPPTDAAVKTKLIGVRQALAVQHGDEAFQRGDWQAALEAYQKAKELGRNGEISKKIDLLKAKLQQEGSSSAGQ
ncbi:MAG TPA: protein kinase [Phycisphaerae bacterium]|nr:protein kinase [Phycisphaerae bacterium]